MACLKSRGNLFNLLGYFKIKMTIYSHSRLGTFEQCKLKYKFHYIDKIKVEGEDTVEAFMGALVHETLEKLYKDLKYSKLCTKEELLDFFESHIELFGENYGL